MDPRRIFFSHPTATKRERVALALVARMLMIAAGLVLLPAAALGQDQGPPEVDVPVDALDGRPVSPADDPALMQDMAPSDEATPAEPVAEAAPTADTEAPSDSATVGLAEPAARSVNDGLIAAQGLASLMRQVRIVQRAVGAAHPNPPFDDLTVDGLRERNLLPTTMADPVPGSPVVHHYGGTIRVRGRDDAFAIEFGALPGFACGHMALSLAPLLGAQDEPSALVVNGRLAEETEAAAIAALNCAEVGNVVMVRFDGPLTVRSLADEILPSSLRPQGERER